MEIVRSTKASIVILKQDKMFAVHGMPSVIKSDNGPPYNGDEDRKYLEMLIGRKEMQRKSRCRKSLEQKPVFGYVEDLIFLNQGR